MNEIEIIDKRQTEMQEKTLKYFLNEYLTLEQIQQLTTEAITFIRDKMKENKISLEQLCVFMKILLDNKGASQDAIVDLIKAAKSELLSKEGKKFKIKEKMTAAEKKLQDDITELLNKHMEKNNKDE